MSPTPGRPATGAAVRRPRITDAVLTAALDVLEEAGYERLSMDEVARRAGVGKAALYRRWSGKLDMVLDALTRLSAPTEQIEAASLADAVEKLLRQAVAWLTDAKIRAVLPTSSPKPADTPSWPAHCEIMSAALGGSGRTRCWALGHRTARREAAVARWPSTCSRHRCSGASPNSSRSTTTTCAAWATSSPTH